MKKSNLALIVSIGALLIFLLIEWEQFTLGFPLGSSILKVIFEKNKNWIKVTKSLVDHGLVEKNDQLELLLRSFRA